MVQVSCQYTKEYVVKTTMELGKRRALFRYMPWLGLLNTVLLLVLWLNSGDSFRFVFVALFFGSCYMLFYYRIVKFNVLKQFEKMPIANKTVHFEFTPEGMRQHGDGGESCVDWAVIDQVVACRDGYLLYPQPRMGIWLGKEAFASEADEQSFRAYAGDKLVTRS